MNLSKSYEFFQPEKDPARIHVVGCGSVGSMLVTYLAKCGVTKMTLWDFDKVESKNIVNQMFRQKDVGRLKVEALRDIVVEDINPDAKDSIIIKPEGWKNELMSGYVFLAVDNIELRREIVERHMNSTFVKAMFDFRTLLEGGQHYAADWSDLKAKKNFLQSMQFSHEEAAEETPVSACGTTLGVVTTVALVCALGVNNYINFTKGNGYWKFANIEGFAGLLDAFKA